MVCLSTYPLLGQSNFWVDLQKSNPQSWTDRAETPLTYRTLSLDIQGLTNVLSTAPMEFVATASPLDIQLPMPDGTLQAFRISESPLMEAGLAAKFPGIRNYSGKGIDNPRARLRISLSHKGFRCLIWSEEGYTVIEPASRLVAQPYISYHSSDLPDTPHGAGWCGTIDRENFPESNTRMVPQAVGHEMLTYRLAVVANSTYTQWAGGTVADALAEINNIISQVTLAMERDMAIRLNLIANNDLLIILPGQTDPYSTVLDQNTAPANLVTNQSYINGIISSNSYDIGHVFIRSTAPGGVLGIAARGSVCRNSTNQNKARGASSDDNPGSARFLETVAHEMGHQFNATHTFNSVNGGCGNNNRSASHAYEPGGGNTIMSYNTCPPDNIPGGIIIYYHHDSQEDFINYTRGSAGATCDLAIPLNNQAPSVDAGTGGMFIPISTPFELTGVASDPDGDSLTYSWEQHDLGPAGSPNSPSGNAPIFRVLQPSNSPTRIFPRLPNILSNSQTTGEILPSYSRDLTFRLTVRDQNGGVHSSDIAFEATDISGPFQVTHPNTQLNLTAGFIEEVEWDVANTTSFPVNCQEVDIYFSTDGGQTFPHLLADNVPNDGQEFVVYPDITTSVGRLKVKAANNVFFDISNQNLNVQLPGNGGFTLLPTMDTISICTGGSAVLPFLSSSLLGFSDPVSLSFLQLPAGITATTNVDTLYPGDPVDVTFTGSNSVAEGTYTVFMTGIAIGGGPSDAVTFIMDVKGATALPQAITAVDPVGMDNIAPTTSFTWDTDMNSFSYEFELSTSPAFGTNVIYTETGLTNNFLSIPFALDFNTVYYWRVRGVNDCGPGEYGEVSGFQVGTCSEVTTMDLPKTIPVFGTPGVVSSTIISTISGSITSVSVQNFKGFHSRMDEIEAKLKGPDGTEVQLFDPGDLCFISGNNQFNVSFASSGGATIPCPPTNGLTYAPTGDLNQFAGKAAFGLWELTVTDGTNFNGGELQDFNLLICTSSSTSLNLVKNLPLTLDRWTQGDIKNLLLEASSAGSPASDIIYTLVDPANEGGLKLNGTTLQAGQTFTQADINNSTLSYLHYGGTTTQDAFTFDLRDQSGGWIGVFTFDIEINETATSIDPILPEDALRIYPNPASESVWVEIDQASAPLIDNIELISTVGQLVDRKTLSTGSTRAQFDVSRLAVGMYFVKINTNKGSQLEKLLIQE